MNKRIVYRLLAAVAVVAGFSCISPSHADAKLVTEADATQAQIKTDTYFGTVKASSDKWMDNATGSARVTPAAKRWQSTTINYKVASGSKYYDAVWRTAVKSWNRGGVVHLVTTSGKPDVLLGTSNSPQGKNGSSVGITYSSYYDHTRLNHLDVLAGAKSYIYRNVADHFHYSKQERTNVAEHELGHALGLEHNVGRSSVMYYATRDQSVAKPDFNGLKQSYR